MPYWYVSRTDRVDYDEYDAFVVKAPNAQKALEFAHNETYSLYTTRQYGLFTADNTTIERLTQSEADGIILGSFNAG